MMRAFAALCLLALCVLVLSSQIGAGEKEKFGIAKQGSAAGTVLVRPGADKPWTLPELQAPILKDADVVVPPGARGVFETKGGVRLTMLGNLPEFSPAAVFESAVRLREPDAVDLDLTLVRGRVLIENSKDGVSKVRLRVDDKRIDVNLLDKGATIALELSSRWPAGTAFVKKPKEDHQPVGQLFLFVLKGNVEAELGGRKRAVEAPAYFRWTTLKESEGPLPLRSAPEWVKTDTSSKTTALHDAVEKVRLAIVGKGLDKGIAAMLNEKVPVGEVAVYTSLALGKADTAWTALNESKSKDLRAGAAAALRAWIDRGQKQDTGLYESLKAGKLKAGQADIVMELLHGIPAEARNRPETYDLLIAYLGSDLQAIRELANHNLVYLAPSGASIAFDAAAPLEKRKEGQAAWRKLIPEGQIPPK